MNKRYEKGRAVEYHIRRKLKEEGYLVIRSGSHTPIDLIAARNGEILAIQVKTKYPSKKEVEKLETWANQFGAKPMTATKRKNRWVLEPQIWELRHL